MNSSIIVHKSFTDNKEGYEFVIKEEVDFKMLVYSQDRKRFGEYKHFWVEKVYGGKKDQKYAVSGMGAAADVLGYFPTEKQALDELAKLFHAYKDGETVYEMKEIGE